MLTRSFSILLLFCTLASCAATRTRDPNVFALNGREVRLTDNLLHDYRRSWPTGTEVKSSLSQSDAQWTLDYIAIAESINRKPACRNLQLTGKVSVQGKEDTIEGKVIKSGTFDEIWLVSSCGLPKRYRIVNPKGTAEFVVYELLNTAF